MATGNNPKLAAFLAELRSSAGQRFSDQPLSLFAGPGRGERRPGPGASPRLQAALAHLGIRQLYSHQATALDALEAGRHILVATPTASGKTLIYNVPVISPSCRSRAAGPCIFFRSRPWNRTSSKPWRNLRPPCPPPPLARPSMTVTPRRKSGKNCASSPRIFSSPTRTCCTWDCCRITSPGAVFFAVEIRGHR